MTAQQSYLCCADCGTVFAAGGDGEEEVCPRGCCASPLSLSFWGPIRPPRRRTWATGVRHRSCRAWVTGGVVAWALLAGGILQAEAASPWHTPGRLHRHV